MAASTSAPDTEADVSATDRVIAPDTRDCRRRALNCPQATQRSNDPRWLTPTRRPGDPPASGRVWPPQGWRSTPCPAQAAVVPVWSLVSVSPSSAASTSRVPRTSRARVRDVVGSGAWSPSTVSTRMRWVLLPRRRRGRRAGSRADGVRVHELATANGWTRTASERSRVAPRARSCLRSERTGHPSCTPRSHRRAPSATSTSGSCR